MWILRYNNYVRFLYFQKRKTTKVRIYANCYYYLCLNNNCVGISRSRWGICIVAIVRPAGSNGRGNWKGIERDIINRVNKLSISISYQYHICGSINFCLASVQLRKYHNIIWLLYSHMDMSTIYLYSRLFDSIDIYSLIVLLLVFSLDYCAIGSRKISEISMWKLNKSFQFSSWINATRNCRGFSDFVSIKNWANSNGNCSFRSTVDSIFNFILNEHNRWAPVRVCVSVWVCVKWSFQTKYL